MLLTTYRGRLITVMLLGVLSTGASVSVPLLVRELVDALGRGGDILLPTLIMASLALGGAALAAASAFVLAKLGEQLILDIRTRIVTHATRLPLPRVRELGNGNLAARLSSDTMQLRAIVDVGVVQVPSAVLTVVVTLAIMAYLDMVLLAATLVVFALAGVAIWGVVQVVRRNVLRQQRSVGELVQTFTAALAALPTIKAARFESRITGRVRKSAEGAARAGTRAARMQALIQPVLELAQQIALVSIVVGGGARLASGALSLPDFAAFIIYLLQLSSPIMVLGLALARLQAGLAARHRVEEVLALPDEDTVHGPGDSGDAVRAGDGGRAQVAGGHDSGVAVELRGVEFDYGAGPVLKGIDLRARRCSLTALVGTSGAGKSTILGLVEGFHQASAGSVEVLGSEIGRWSLSGLRSKLAYVDQTYSLVESSLRENLTLGSEEDVDDDRLMAVLEHVGMAHTIDALPEGLDTVIGAVTDLSGGQRQRVAIARALLSEAEIVLLDEPASQLDSIHETQLRALIEDLAQDKAVILVAHRMASVVQADHIVVLEDGRVVDSGVHEELSRRSGQYRALLQGQRIAPDRVRAQEVGAK